MHIKPDDIPKKSQLHSRKYHLTYNGTRHLPTATWVRTPTLQNPKRGDCTLVYEVVLYYGHNRACTIYRTWDDFIALRRGLPPSKSNPGPVCCENDVQSLHRLLLEALAKRPRESCAMEYFLRRRMDDCGGRCC